MTGKKEGLGGVDGGWGSRRGEGDRGWGRLAGGAPLLYGDNAKPGQPQEAAGLSNTAVPLPHHSLPQGSAEETGTVARVTKCEAGAATATSDDGIGALSSA
ncbi:TPA: hypothetical protein ACH3X3_007343 [Trebouxia sp. C0006]